MTNTRQPIKSGTYGIVHVYDVYNNAVRVLVSDIKHSTADELNEAAHLFNQLAEQLRETADPAYFNKVQEPPQLTKIAPNGEVHVRASANAPWIESGVKLSVEPPPIPADAPAREQPQFKLDADTPIMGNVAKMQDRADAAYKQAVSLLHAINKRHWPEGRPIAPQFTLAGVLDQIDHITASLVRPAPPRAIDPLTFTTPQFMATNDPQRSHPFEPSTWSKASCRICNQTQDHPRHTSMGNVADSLPPSMRKMIVELVQESVNKIMSDYEPKLRNT